MDPVTQTAIALIDAHMERKQPIVVAIDGRCASGKTTLALSLQQHYRCGVVSMDHFFLRPEQRTCQRLDTPGENVDHERFLEEVLLPLKRGEAVRYCPFDCGSQSFGLPVELVPGDLVVVEGSYSCHRDLWDHYDLRLFLTVDPDVQMQRLIARNGDYAQVFRDRWIPLEEAYFSAFDIGQRCDLSLCTG